MRVARFALIAALGFFALVAQTLLFRRFLTAFSGSELALGCFFGSWLVWVGMGAALGRRLPRLERGFVLLCLAYIPAFLLQFYGITHARALAGVASYELFPLVRLAVGSFLLNAPVSFFTGLLFTQACAWLASLAVIPVARAYALEAAGSVLGGLFVTAALWQGMSEEGVFAFAAMLLLVPPAVLGLWRETRRRGIVEFLPILLLAFLAMAWVSGQVRAWTESNRHQAWARLLPIKHYKGSFTTAQAQYLYGEIDNAFVVMAWGGVVESFPDQALASEVVALHLAEQPRATRVLIIGPGGAALSARFLDIPQIKSVTWLHPDPELPTALLARLGARIPAAKRAKIHTPVVDARALVESRRETFDLILLTLPEVTTLACNRFATQEFFFALKHDLGDQGVLSVQLTGGENYLGSELGMLGASAWRTVGSVFPYLALKPGDESWLLASQRGGLSEAASELETRFMKIPGAAEVFPPAGMRTLYLRDRIAFQKQRYREAASRVPEDLLLNRDQRPRALLHGLLVAAHRAGLSLAASVPVIADVGFWLVASALLLYGLLRCLTLLQHRQGHTAKRVRQAWMLDAKVLVLLAGAVSMSLSVVLMFLFQARFGSLFLHVGLVTGLFMLGSVWGCMLLEGLLVRWGHEPLNLLALIVLLHLGVLAWVARVGSSAGLETFGVLFLLAGLFTGVYMPLAAWRLRHADVGPQQAGAALETADHVGGAVGALVTGVAVVPLLGTHAVLGLLAVMVSINLLPHMACLLGGGQPVAGRDWIDRVRRPVGLTLLGVGAFCLLASYRLTHAEAAPLAATMPRLQQARAPALNAPAVAPAQARKLQTAARQLTGVRDLHYREVSLPRGKVLSYFVLTDAEGRDQGFVFDTGPLAGDAHGYSGPIRLAVYVNQRGEVQSYQVLAHSESPDYFDLLKDWHAKLKGKNVFQPKSLANVDATTGATFSARGILQTLAQAGPRFHALLPKPKALPDTPASPPSESTPAPTPVVQNESPFCEKEALYLLLAVFGALFLRLRRTRRTRLAFLALTACTGAVLNVQYSTDHVFSLLSGGWSSGNGCGVLLVVGVPLVGLLVGNLYCGYICPFGALQELAGEWAPAWLGPAPSKRVWRYGRTVKYMLLFLLVVLFSLWRDRRVLGADPLLVLFRWPPAGGVLLAGGLLLLVSMKYKRFWCRNLCPAGAFLSLTNRVRLLRRWLPQVRPARCDLGVRTVRETDCLHCDRCLHESV